MMREITGNYEGLARVYEQIVLPILVGEGVESDDRIVFAEDETGSNAIIMWNEEDFAESTTNLMLLELTLKHMVESKKLDGYKMELNEQFLNVIEQNSFSVNVKRAMDVEEVMGKVFAINNIYDDRLSVIKMPVSLTTPGFFEYLVVCLGTSDEEMVKLSKSLSVAGLGKKIRKVVEANRSIVDQSSAMLMRDVVTPVAGVVGDVAGNVGVGVVNAATEGVVSAANNFFAGLEVGNILTDGRVDNIKSNAKQAGAQIMSIFRKGGNTNKTSFGTF